MPLPTSFVVKNGSKIFEHDFFRNARPVIGQFEEDDVALHLVPRARDERAAAVRRDHRLFRVDDQVEDHLLQLMRIGEHLRNAGGERVDDHHVREMLFMLA